MKTRQMILIALFAALTGIGAFIKIPTPLVPYTLQYLFCAYAGIFLGSKDGLYSQLLYITIGLVGFPIFASGGGPAYVLQPTFGYLMGFAAGAYVIGLLIKKLKNMSFVKVYSIITIGLMMVYLFGVSYMYLIVNFYLNKQMDIMKAIAVGFTPYIVFDLGLNILITITALRVVPILRRAGYLK